MHKVSVDISAFYGYGCGGCSYSSGQSNQFEVSDQVASLLTQMRTNKGEDIDQDDIEQALQNGLVELQDLYDAIENEHHDMVVRYWLFEADNDCIDESLEPYFWQDIENGLYEPEQSMEELINAYREEHPDEEDFWNWNDKKTQRNIYYDELCQHYLNWVNSHTDDYWFIAERVGVELDVVYEDMPDLEFTITEIKEE